jgi:hypothetical protein
VDTKRLLAAVKKREAQGQIKRIPPAELTVEKKRAGLKKRRGQSRGTEQKRESAGETKRHSRQRGKECRRQPTNEYRRHSRKDRQRNRRTQRERRKEVKIVNETQRGQTHRKGLGGEDECLREGRSRREKGRNSLRQYTEVEQTAGVAVAEQAKGPGGTEWRRPASGEDKRRQKWQLRRERKKIMPAAEKNRVHTV